MKPAGASSTNCEVCFCDRNTVNLATLVFIFQIVYGLVSLGCMVFMWYVDSDDDVAEMKEAAEWAEAEKMEAKTCKGKLKKVNRIIFTSLPLHLSGHATAEYGPFLQRANSWCDLICQRRSSPHRLSHSHH